MNCAWQDYGLKVHHVATSTVAGVMSRPSLLQVSCLDLHCCRCHVATSTVARKSISQPPSASFRLLVADNTLLVTRAFWTDHVAWLGVMALLEAVLTELMFALGAFGHG